MESLGKDTSNTASGAQNVVQARSVGGDVHIHNWQGALTRTTPRELPAAVRHFVGRITEQETLTEWLSNVGLDPIAHVATVAGLAGVGKTALVVQWAHRQQDRFTDGELYVNLRGFDPASEPLTPADALAGLLTALGVAPEEIPSTEAGRTTEFRTRIHGRRMLLVLDNALDSAQVLPLIPGTPNCLTLVTSRVRLDGLVAKHGAQQLTLTTLSHGEGHRLLECYLGSERLANEPDSVAEILHHCSGLPLALTLVAAQCAASTDLPLQELAANLRTEHNLLDVLDTERQLGVRTVFSWSYRKLTRRAADLFRRLGIIHVPDISLLAASALAGIDQNNTRRALNELCRAHLIIYQGNNRYELHDLVRAYAQEKAIANDSGRERAEALQRLADHYLYTTLAASKRLEPTQRLPKLDHTDERLTHELLTREEALNWWDAEYRCVLATIRQVTGQRFARGPWLAHSTIYLLTLRGRIDELKPVATCGLQAARANADRTAEARLLANLGHAHFFRNEIDLTVEHLTAAAGLFAELGERDWEASSHIALGEAHVALGHYTEAATSARRALEIITDFDEGDSRGAAHAVLGLALAYQDDFSGALAHLQSSLDLTSQFGRGFTLTSIAITHRRAGNTEEAIHRCRQAVQHRHDIGHRLGEAASLRELGSALQDADETSAAREAWQQALTILRDLSHPDAERLRIFLELESDGRE